MATSPNGLTADIQYVNLSSVISTVKLSSEIQYAKLTADISIKLTSEYLNIPIADTISVADSDTRTIGINFKDTVFVVDTEIVNSEHTLNGGMFNTQILGTQAIPADPDNTIVLTII